MNSIRYDEWEAAQIEYARRVAQLCLDTFTSGHKDFSFNCPWSKTVMEYILCKVFHILLGSTPSLGFLHIIKKRGDTLRVLIILYEQD